MKKPKEINYYAQLTRRWKEDEYTDLDDPIEFAKQNGGFFCELLDVHERGDDNYHAAISSLAELVELDERNKDRVEQRYFEEDVLLFEKVDDLDNMLDAGKKYFNSTGQSGTLREIKEFARENNLGFPRFSSACSYGKLEVYKRKLDAQRMEYIEKRDIEKRKLDSGKNIECDLNI